MIYHSWIVYGVGAFMVLKHLCFWFWFLTDKRRHKLAQYFRSITLSMSIFAFPIHIFLEKKFFFWKHKTSTKYLLTSAIFASDSPLE